MSEHQPDRGTHLGERPSEDRHAEGAGRVTIGLADGESIKLHHLLTCDVELVIGEAAAADRLLILRGDICPELQARYIVVQPETFAADPTRGWIPLGGVHDRTRMITPDTSSLDLQSRDEHLYCRLSVDESSELMPLVIESDSRHGIAVLCNSWDILD